MKYSALYIKVLYLFYLRTGDNLTNCYNIN